jgi:hypothetical protein
MRPNLSWVTSGHGACEVCECGDQLAFEWLVVCWSVNSESESYAYGEVSACLNMSYMSCCIDTDADSALAGLILAVSTALNLGQQQGTRHTLSKQICCSEVIDCIEFRNVMSECSSMKHGSSLVLPC